MQNIFQKASFFKENGLDIEVSGLDLARLKNRTDLLKSELRSGLLWMMKKSGIEFLYGTAHFVDDETIEVAGEKITFDKCIIATGSPGQSASSAATRWQKYHFKP